MKSLSPLGFQSRHVRQPARRDGSLPLDLFVSELDCHLGLCKLSPRVFFWGGRSVSERKRSEVAKLCEASIRETEERALLYS